MIFSSETRKTIPSLNPTAIIVLYTVYLQYNIVIGHGAVITTDHFAYKNKVIALMFRQRFFFSFFLNPGMAKLPYICICTHDPTEDAFYARMETILPFYCYCTVARFASMLGSSALRTQKRGIVSRPAVILLTSFPSSSLHIQTLPHLSRNNFQ